MYFPTFADVGATANSPICAGGTINLSASTGNSYAWSGPNGYSSTAQNPAISNATAVSGGVYTVVISTGGTCTARATVNVVVNPNPTASATGATACEGGSVTLAAAGGSTYEWSGANGYTSAQQNPTISSLGVSNAGVYTVKVTASGCTATATANVSVTPKPTFSATASAVTCTGSTLKKDGKITLSGFASTERFVIVQGTTFTGSVTYQSATDIPANGNIKTDVENPVTSAGQSYTIRVINATGCYKDVTVLVPFKLCDCEVPVCVPFVVTKTKSARR